MPYTYEFVDQANCVVSTWTGERTLKDVAVFLGHLERHPKFRVGLNRLFDFRGSRTAFNLGDGRTLGYWVKHSDAVSGERRVAFLVDTDADDEVMRQFMSSASESKGEMHVTRDIEEARDWVGLPPKYVLPADR